MIEPDQEFDCQEIFAVKQNNDDMTRSAITPTDDAESKAADADASASATASPPHPPPETTSDSTQRTTPSTLPETTPSPPTKSDDSFTLGRLHRVDRRYIKTEAFGWWILTLINFFAGGIPLLVLSLNSVGPTWLRLSLIGVWSALVLLLVALTRRYPAWEYRRTRYRVTSKGIEIRKGVIWRQIINVPRNRVQHTDVTQGPLLRHYGLASLVIHTAGTTHLPSLSKSARHFVSQVHDKCVVPAVSAFLVRKSCRINTSKLACHSKLACQVSKNGSGVSGGNFLGFELNVVSTMKRE